MSDLDKQIEKEQAALDFVMQDAPQAIRDLAKIGPRPDQDTKADTRTNSRDRVRRHRATAKQAAAIEFVRTDASLFLHPDRLSQKAGAPKKHLRRMAIKELVDNALDAAATATLSRIDADTFTVEDDGPGIAPDKVVELFSVTRPMISSKLIRRPTRGMVGNGLRVATGAAFASGGQITIESRKVRQVLDFDRATGETVVAEAGDSTIERGTLITVEFGAALPTDSWTTLWGDLAIRLAGPSATPMLTHPEWYSEAAFQELIEAARGTAQDLASLFGVDLCNASFDKFEQGQSDHSERYIDPTAPASELTLALLRRMAPPPPKLLPVPEDAFEGAYRIERAEAVGTTIPVIVQAWAQQKDSPCADDITLIVNRTPTVADLSLYPGGDAYLKGCGLFVELGQVPKGSYSLTIAINTPAIALISDGKTPDLTPFRDTISGAVGSALRKSHRPTRRGISIRDAAFCAMAEAYLKASANGTLPANARQIMYAARPTILKLTGHDRLNDAYFTQTLLPAFIEDNPETTASWDVVYDARGHLVEPHTDHSIPLGTLHVRDYLQRRQRDDYGSLISTASGLHHTAGPGDRYGAVLFIEKEGFEPLIRAARIAERFDIAVMSTKGMSVIAARALIDRISAQGLPILVAHDLDIAGIRIFGTLGSDSARYSFTHRPDIRRLGLTLEQAEAMNLQGEQQRLEGDHSKILEGLRRHGATDDELMFIASHRRVELNAMASDQFVRWLEAGLREHDVQKVIPSAEMIEARARRLIGLRYVRDHASDIERRARDHVDRAELPADLVDRIRLEFERDPTMPWEDALDRALPAPTGGAKPDT